MNKLLLYKEDAIKKALLWGIPLIFIVGSIFHFLFDITSGNIIFAVIFPTNESIFSHLKLTYFPVLIYFFIAYIVLHNEDDINASKWTISAAMAVFVGIAFVTSAYYIATAAFNIYSLIVDISIFFVSVVLGQLMAIHVYKHSSGGKLKLALAIIFLIVVLVMFYLFTVNPPNLPLFIE